MARSRKNKRNQAGPSYEGPRYRPKWVWASLCLLLGLLLTVAFFDFRPGQSLQNSTNPTDVNLVGRFGAETSWWSFYLLGGAAWLIPVFLLWLAYLLLRRVRRLTWAKVGAMLLCLATGAGGAAMQSTIFIDTELYPAGPGGVIGGLLYDTLLKDTMGTFGSGLLLAMTYFLGILFILTRDIVAEFERMIAAFQEWRARRKEMRAHLAELKKKRKEEEKKNRELLAGTKANGKTPTPAAASTPAIPTRATESTQPSDSEKPAERKEDVAQKELAVRTAAAKAAVAAAMQKAGQSDDPKDKTGDAESAKLNLKIIEAKEMKKAAVVPPVEQDGEYVSQFLDRLSRPVKPDSASEEEHQQNATNLLRILSEFGVKVDIGEIHVGPVITCYEVVPAAGVRVEKIANLDKNIALGMRAQSVRIIAPIPGKAAVGVEVPNRHATPVGLREIFESVDWVKTRAEIPIALGKDVSGAPLMSDLTRMPHLLIAGATGSGKSVCINSIITSIVYRASPRQVRLLMVDPKIVELQIFNALPHMLIPVVTEARKVPSALKWLLREMERRYQMFAKSGVRNISGFNNRKKSKKPEMDPVGQDGTPMELPGLELDDGTPIPEHLPYIVAIIDELSDLMMVAPAEVESSIARLAQLARAAGLHLIIATQRPSVNVITGLIKANLPSRIAFQVASQIDSRTIIDTKGADSLIGRGDMLFSPPGTSRLVRAQGAFVSDDEVKDIVEFLKEKNGPPQYAEDVQEQIDRDPDADGSTTSDGEAEPGLDEELLHQAIDVLKSTRRASTSMLQRRLRIGYNRAARVMELMEEKGIVGPENGSAPREILVDLDNM